MLERLKKREVLREIMQYIIKKQPEDFLVQEALCSQFVPMYHTEQDDLFGLYIIQKKGFTTFESVNIISDFFKIPTVDLGYAGLKDEDAITFQFMTIPKSYILKNEDINKFNSYYANKNSFIQITHHGYCPIPIQVGKLIGNSFSIVVRNICPEMYMKYKGMKSYNLYMLNYYDIQRFGLPNSVKKTHEIGFHLIQKNYDEARNILCLMDSPEKIKSLNFIGSSEEFFHSLEPRTLSFYYNSWESNRYNHQLAELLKKYDYNVITQTYDGISYVFTKNKKVLIDILNDKEFLSIEKHYYDGEKIIQRTSQRPSIINTTIQFNKWDEDIMHKGKFMLQISFFLPSGSYATLAVKQMMIYLMNWE